MTIAVEAICENGVLKLDRPLDLAEPTCFHVVIESDVVLSRTALGAKLCALREEIPASGAPTFGWDEISEETHLRGCRRSDRRDAGRQ